MSGYRIWLVVDVKAGERVLLLRNGVYERVLAPGRYRLLDLKHALTIERHAIVRAEMPAERYAVLKAERPDLAEALLALVETKADELAVVSFDGRPTHLMGPWQVTRLLEGRDRSHRRAHRYGDRSGREPASPDVDRPRAYELRERDHRREPRSRPALSRGQAGRAAHAGASRLLDREPQVEVKRLDLRPQAVEVTAQEMLTKDRIALRLTLTAFRRIVDPEKAAGDGRRCRWLALSPGAVRHPRGRGRADPGRSALGQERARCRAS